MFAKCETERGVGAYPRGRTGQPQGGAAAFGRPFGPAKPTAGGACGPPAIVRAVRARRPPAAGRSCHLGHSAMPKKKAPKAGP